ncbi:MAG: RidA family protein [Betaproteobacteria bacterium]|nr:MAG: RidA family protein [Betaproteobacteria bacterium]
MKILQPAHWAPPRGYANGIAARGELVFVAGQIGWNAAQKLESTDIVGQARQALANIVAVLAEAGARPEHIVRMTWYVTNKREYRDAYGRLGAVYRDVIGRHFPAMTAVEVSGLIEDGAKIEIEATAVIPDGGRDV